MWLKVLTDEDITPEVSQRLQKDGYDVYCSRDLGLLHLKDWHLMRWCIEHQRTICVKNRRHFEREHRLCLERGEGHSGILVVGDWKPDAMYWALRQYLEQTDPNLPPLNRLIYLVEASPDFIAQRSEG